MADAIDLYDGSAGGTSFSLAATGFSSISYIRVTGIGNAGEIDGFSRVGFANTGVVVVPEPGTMGLIFFAGVGGLVCRCVRRKGGVIPTRTDWNR
ncbi:MAG: PEP-CTERM sorting domain-containing protein [Akkermansiaceae bacterium]|nr:PEP-CTERM sorting domain-containing protein [Armatimonadota bacterium]